MKRIVLSFSALGLLAAVISCSPPPLEVKDYSNDLTRYIDSSYLQQYHSPVYYVIVGSLKDSASAAAYSKRLSESREGEQLLHSDECWRVAAGRFRSHKKAIKYRDLYNSTHPGTGAWILTDTLSK